MSYQVDLEIFNGPMDLLLYLISREEVDIQEVSITRIVDQYMEYLARMKELDVEISSDFLVMAATLMLIKSKAMLPVEEIDLEVEMDQQDELIHHLLEYKKFKVLSRGLRERADIRSTLVGRAHHDDHSMEEAYTYEEISLWDLLKAFSKILRETGLDRSFQVIHSEKPLMAYISTILDVLVKQEQVQFDSLFMEERTRGEAISIFVGLLEIVKQKLARVRQDETSGELYVKLRIEPEKLEALKRNGKYEIQLLAGEGRSFPGEEELLELVDPFEAPKVFNGESAFRAEDPGHEDPVHEDPAREAPASEEAEPPAGEPGPKEASTEGIQ